MRPHPIYKGKKLILLLIWIQNRTSLESRLFIYMVVKIPLSLVWDSRIVVVILGIYARIPHIIWILKKHSIAKKINLFFFSSLNKSIGIGTKSFLTINLCLSKLWKVFMSMYFLVAWEVKSIGYLCKNTTHYMNLKKNFIAKTINLFSF